MKPCDHDAYPVYRRLIGPLRERARALGYALAVHGSLKRDIDLVAVPWADGAVPARDLALALQAVAREHNGGKADMSWSPGRGREYALDGCPGNKPHGRLGWCFSLGGGPYIDLAVLPPAAGPDGAAQTKGEEGPETAPPCPGGGQGGAQGG